MKKSILFFFFLFAFSTFAQNFQLHYDMGKDRKYFTSTIEMFKPDEYGATFFFVDFDFNRGGNNSISLAYFEIARYINIPGVKGLSGTIQYNDGTAPWGPLGHIWLGGASYSFDVPFGLSVDLLARKDYLSDGLDGQITVVWFKPFFDGKLTFTGFLDIWTYTNATDEKDIVLLTEPQLWYNLGKHLAIGTEIEISHKFLPPDINGEYKLEINPTIAAKWNF